MEKIIGGMEAPRPIPWQVSIWNVTFPHVCGGVILDEKTILTASHCIILNEETGKLKEYFVMAGSTRQRSGTNIIVDHVALYNEQIRPHRAQLDDDIIILKLRDGLTFSENIQPICLPSVQFDPKEGTQCYVSGWGNIYGSIPSNPEYLQWSTMKIVNTETCNDTLSCF